MDAADTACEDMHAFAMRWIPRFEDWGYGQLFETMDFSDDCRALGFEMDCGGGVRGGLPRLLPQRGGDRARDRRLRGRRASGLGIALGVALLQPLERLRGLRARGARLVRGGAEAARKALGIRHLRRERHRPCAHRQTQTARATPTETHAPPAPAQARTVRGAADAARACARRPLMRGRPLRGARLNPQRRADAVSG